MQKFINILVIVFFGITLYYTVIVDFQRVKAMNTLSESDVELQGHKSMIDNEYKRLDNKFIGRGKHMQRMAADIVSLDSKLDAVVDSLGNKIEENAYFLRQLEERLDEDIRNLQGDITGLSDELSTYKRRTNRSITDMREEISTLQSDLKALDEKLSPVEEEEK